MELSVSMEVIGERQTANSLYSPSWIDRLTAWIDERPAPAWCFYLLMALLVVGVQLVIAWWEGSYRHAMFGFATVFTGSSVCYLAMIHYLDKMAVHAMDKFHPSLQASEQQATDLAYRSGTSGAQCTPCDIVEHCVCAVDTNRGRTRGHPCRSELFWHIDPCSVVLAYGLDR